MHSDTLSFPAWWAKRRTYRFNFSWSFTDSFASLNHASFCIALRCVRPIGIIPDQKDFLKNAQYQPIKFELYQIRNERIVARKLKCYSSNLRSELTQFIMLFWWNDRKEIFKYDSDIGHIRGYDITWETHHLSVPVYPSRSPCFDAFRPGRRSNSLSVRFSFAESTPTIHYRHHTWIHITKPALVAIQQNGGELSLRLPQSHEQRVSNTRSKPPP